MNPTPVIANNNTCPTSGGAFARGVAYPGAINQQNHHATPGGGGA
ncbi:hypothetical protein [Variovorax sp. GB1P17]